ncbi:hypothetical protein ABPG77_008677 [Micractinium sp. CCAP 211/92]
MHLNYLAASPILSHLPTVLVEIAMQGDTNVNAEAQRVLAAGHDRWAQLGLTRGADLAEVKKRYKRLCALHPDKNLGNALAAEAFAIVSAAYAELTALLAPAGAPTATAGPLHAGQAEAQQQTNRWQAFTGRWQPRQQQAAPQQAAPPAAQHPRPGSSSQENRTPETDSGSFGQQHPATGACGSRQNSRWGKQAGTALFRAQPLVPAQGTACPASGQDGSMHGQQQQGTLLRKHSSPRASLSSSSSSFNSGSDASDSEDAAAAAISRPIGACVQPAAFYGSGSTHHGPAVDAGVAAASAVKPPAASLYGLFSGRRSGGGQAGGWPGSQQPLQGTDQPKWVPPQTQSLAERRLTVEQPAQQKHQQQHPQQHQRQSDHWQRDQLAWVQQQHQQGSRLSLWRQAAAQPSPPLGSLQQEQARLLGSPSCQRTSPQAEARQGSQPGNGACGSWAGQAGSRWSTDRSKLELLKRPAAFAVPAASGLVSSQLANAKEQGQQEATRGRASGQAKRRLRELSSSSDEGRSSDDEGESNSDEGSASDFEPVSALSAREQLMQAVLHQQAAERRAVQAEGAAIARAGRDKALHKYRTKRRKKGASSSKAGAGCSGRGTGSRRNSGKPSTKGSGVTAGSGGGTRQTQLQLVLVRGPAA